MRIKARRNYKLRVIPSFLWMARPVGCTVVRTEPGVYAYRQIRLERA